MKRILLTIIIVTIPIHAQKSVVLGTTKVTQATVNPPSPTDYCNYINFTVDKREISGSPTTTTVTYIIKNCDGSIAYNVSQQVIPNESYVVDTKFKTHTLNVTSPINVFLIWRYPVNWSDVYEGNWVLTASDGSVTNNTESQEVISAKVEGIVLGRNVSVNATGKVATASTKSTKR